MADNMAILNTNEREDDWIVTVSVQESEFITQDKLREIRARAKAMIEVGVASRNLLLEPDIALEVPSIERKTELIREDEVGDGVWEYEVRVNKGAVI